jgi:hypothetical protein
VNGQLLGLPVGPWWYQVGRSEGVNVRGATCLWVRHNGKPAFRAFFTGLSPAERADFPDHAVLVAVEASRFEDDPEAARAWIPDACERYGGQPVWLDTWDERLSWHQGRWIDRETGQPVPVGAIA